MLKKMLGIAFLLIACLFVNCYAMQPSEYDNKVCSIAKVVNNKAYLKPGSVQIAQNGIFIYVEGQLVAINHLEMDEQGVYFDCSKVYSGSECPGCGKPLVLGFICINPECRFSPFGD